MWLTYKRELLGFFMTVDLILFVVSLRNQDGKISSLVTCTEQKRLIFVTRATFMMLKQTVVSIRKFSAVLVNLVKVIYGTIAR